MSERSVTHATFVLARVYDATPARVFRAWSETEAKQRWFASEEGWELRSYDLDFRVGGREHAESIAPGGVDHRYDAIYQDIVPDIRIVSTYEMHLDGVRISVSLATVELRPEGPGTRLVFTEQGAYLDGYDDAGAREQGTQELLDALGEELSASR